MATARKPSKAQQKAHDEVAARARALGMQVRYARSIKSPGAICQVKDKLILFVKRTLDIDDQTAIMENELERFEKLGMRAVQAAPEAAAEAVAADAESAESEADVSVSNDES